MKKSYYVKNKAPYNEKDNEELYRKLYLEQLIWLQETHVYARCDSSIP